MLFILHDVRYLPLDIIMYCTPPIMPRLRYVCCLASGDDEYSGFKSVQRHWNHEYIWCMWYKASISWENVCGSFVSSTCRDTFNVMTYDTISPLQHHEMLATCRDNMSDTSPIRRIICRFGTNGRCIVIRHCQLSCWQTVLSRQTSSYRQTEYSPRSPTTTTTLEESLQND